jgi:glycosyltransferase involved in cell wall biosynthesis
MMGDKRIAYLTSQYPATSHTFIRREVEALRGLGVPLDTFSIRPPSSSELADEVIARDAAVTFTVLRQPLTSFLAAHSVTLVTQPVAYVRTLSRALHHRAPGFRSFGLAIAHFGEAILLARELRKRGISRLHNHFANSGATVGYLAASLLDMPWSFTMHGISETDYPAGLLLGRKIEAADFVVCVSYFGRAQAMRLVAPEQWDKLHVVRCGVPVPTIAQRKPSKRKEIISVGRLSAEKGHAGLLQAFATLSDDRPDTALVIVGDGPERAALRATAGNLGIADRVTFTGRLGEPETLERIAAADILVLSSFMEGLPIVLMEAMAAGTPVIASRVAGIPELIDDGKNGLLFTPSNWEELAGCMRRLLDDEALREGFAERGRVTIESEFDARRSAEILRGLLCTDLSS